MTLRRLSPLMALVVSVLLPGLSGCGGRGNAESSESSEMEARPLPDTLRVATLYSPTSYFLYRDQEMGYDYSLVTQWAEEKGMVVDLTVAPSMARLVEMLDSGDIDLAAYEIPVTAEYRQQVVACGPEYVTTQVLVQPLKDGKPEITDETQLIGRDVYVEAGSKYDYRLRNLDSELGGGIRIHEVDRDTLITEDLVGMVSDGTIPLTVVDSDIARINKTYYRDLDVSLPLSFPQKASWGVAPGNEWLADSVNEWFLQEAPKRRQAELLKRYFELSKNGDADFTGAISLDLSKGVISPYDAIFRSAAKKMGWDWRILAAVGYAESGFKTNLVSWAGARGLMQIMPRSAVAYGLPIEKIEDPQANIEAAARILADLDRSLAKKVPASGERLKFVIAAYNSGIGHIYDAIALAGKYGRDPQVWDGNVEQALLMKANPEYYSDPVCRNGYFGGRHTVAYVRKVSGLLERFRQKIPSS
ncbi:MAG: transglycosylase SLT domain-containing protein [Muribaculaceae bacterium]|nr:transglycosylase SLT domain-containing protein [Muribaculaceae bacterium]